MISLPSLRSKNKRTDLDSILPLTHNHRGKQTSVFGYIYDTSATIGTVITGSIQVQNIFIESF